MTRHTFDTHLIISATKERNNNSKIKNIETGDWTASIAFSQDNYHS